MSKDNWLKALYNELRENATFAYHWAASQTIATYSKAEAIKYAGIELQQAYKERIKTFKAGQNRRMRDNAMRSCGLTKVYGSVSGKVYWE